MNHLAHFVLAGEGDDWRLGALLGDFRKGPISNPYPDAISAGVMLHRTIDAFCDRHPLTRQVNELFPATSRRLSRVLLDLCRDHFLSRHFDRFHPQPLEQYAADIYALLARQKRQLPVDAARFGHALQQHDLLCRYLDPAAVGPTLHRIVTQRLGEQPSLQQLEELWLVHYGQIEENFLDFFPLLLDFAAAERERLSRAIAPVHP